MCWEIQGTEGITSAGQAGNKISVFIKYQNLTESFIVDCIIYFYLGGLTAQIFKATDHTKYQKWILAFSLVVAISPLIFLNEDFVLFQLHGIREVKFESYM